LVYIGLLRYFGFFSQYNVYHLFNFKINLILLDFGAYFEKVTSINPSLYGLCYYSVFWISYVSFL